jgi:membrane protein DedA with SNARE-associated domain
MPTLPIHEWIKLLGQFYDQYGYLVVFLGTMGENTALLGLFLPGNSLALLGAAYARLGTLNLGWVIFFATLGTILGYNIDYFIGRFVLVKFATQWSATRFGRRIRLAARLRLGRMLLNKHGGKAILISHLVGHLRSFVALSAGLTHMRYLRFLGFEVVAATIWNTAFCLLGYLIAAKIDLLQVILERSGWVILAILLLLFLAWRIFGQRAKQRIRRERRQARRKARSMVLR